jgi:hypothetical protein
MNALDTIRQLMSRATVDIQVADFLIALVLAEVSAGIVSALYQVFYEERATGSQIHRSFLLLSPAITALFIAIQYSLPLSLGLVGALTIIRFRTPVKEPEEVGFLMLIIASAIVCATFHYLLLVALLGLAIVVLVAQRYLPRLFGSRRNDGVLLLTLDGDATEAARQGALRVVEQNLRNPRLQSVSYAEGATTIHYSFAGLRLEDLHLLRGSLEGMGPVRKLNVFFNRQGVLA